MKRLSVLITALALLLGAFGAVAVAGGVASGAPAEVSSGNTVMIAPCRIADSRQWQQLQTFAAFQTEGLPVSGHCGIPGTATGVFLSITAVPFNNVYPGYLTVWPADGTPRPEVSQVSVNWQTVSGQVLVGPLPTSGNVSIFNGSTGWTDVIVDAEGYVAG